ncbi:TfpX/TfpZ family type IV pilin accessory protein [Paracidovorax sp. MALMAid1276]|uniref:TfpX/TfpZ family type IV pilin accessory protein n=1 Tax=Paracidovorax sp. MALMAid1276 TaxID=3411631 RepID=UPI003B9B57BE
MRHRYRAALKAAAAHFLITLGIAALTAILVFQVWFPWPFYEIVAGRELFWLVISVDVVCGPLLTLALWNPAKSSRELTIDMALIGFIQIGALIYGINTVTETRPVRLVFEVDRLRLVSAAEINREHLGLAVDNLQHFSWTGPVLVGIRQPKNNQEMIESIDLSLGGLEPSLRPGWWQPYDLSVSEVLKAARPISVLRKNRPADSERINDAVRMSKLPESELRWLPLTAARSFDWVVFLDKQSAQPVSYARVDGFFH